MSSLSSFYIGLMSGTSMDGVDGVLVDFSQSGCWVLAHHGVAFSADLKAQMLALNVAGFDEIHRMQLAANQLSVLYAQVVAGLLYAAELDASEIAAIGAHGQTVRHRPSGSVVDGGGYTVQLNNPALLAERTGIDVVADFRSRDVAAGGQGAPLVPLFHQAVFGQAGCHRAVLNIGGIANVSLLYADGRVLGFDTGPGNVLMDAWVMQHKGVAYDANGAWAATGRVLPPLLEAFLADAYFAKPIPKSTGRDVFHAEWLKGKLAVCPEASFQDVQATLAELTVQSVARALKQYAPDFDALYVCGGGACNHYVMRRLAEVLAQMDVQTTQALGMPVMQVEAAAFAWLARQCVNRQALFLGGITQAIANNLPQGQGGQARARVLGAIYPA